MDILDIYFMINACININQLLEQR